MCKEIESCGESTAADVPANITRAEWDAQRIQVMEMHAMMSQLAGILKQMESHPMLSAFLR